MNETIQNRPFDEKSLSSLVGQSVCVRVFDEIDSTNNEAKRMALDGIDTPVLIAAERQTAGRGRMGRSFYSPATTGAYFSILYPLHTPLHSTVSITGAVAVAVMRAIRTLTGKQTAIKWVNDLYLDEKKVCGILCEAVTVGSMTHLIIGVGVNLSTKSFPNELDGRAGSLGVEGDLRAALIAEVWRTILPSLRDPHDRAWLDDYRTHSCVIGRAITWVVGEKTQQGVAVGINEDGELLAEREDGQTMVLRMGEITLRVRS